ncbi:MAG TPA: hypothetical protein V6C91_02690 [Coleofasciculaceae cyanobacterium]
MNTKNQAENTEQEQQQSDSMQEGCERLAEANPDDFSAPEQQNQ